MKDALAGQPCGSRASLTCDGEGNCVGCTEPADCPTGEECTTPACNREGTCALPPKAPGTPCGSGEALLCDGDGHCVDCVERADCPMDEECTTYACNMGDGTCESTFKANGTECGDAASCTLGVFTFADACDGSGMCKDAAETDCSPYACNGTSCLTTCTLPADCTTAVCFHSSCCDAGCSGLCMTCAGGAISTGPIGTCAPVKAGSDPYNECGGPSDNCNGTANQNQCVWP